MRAFLCLCLGLHLPVGLSVQEDGKCSPQSPIFNLVMGQHEGNFVVDGAPEIAFKKDNGSLEGLPRSCQRFGGNASCCKLEFYEQLNEAAKDEASRFKKLEDVYSHLVADALDPAMKELEAASKGDMARQVSEVKIMLEQWQIGEAVKVYIDSCEDPLRLHFTALSCELCNPALEKKLLEGKYMEVDSQACTNLYLPCMRSVGSLEGIGAELEEASRKLKILINDEGADTENVKHAYKWLSGAARQMKATYKRAGFYKERETFCRKIAEKGFKYDPEDWANLDYMHPSMGLTDAQEEQEEKSEKELHEREKLPDAAGQCIHGFLRENNCICSPCWEGVNCDTEAAPGPRRLQPYSPLVAEDVVGSQQPFTVVGCRMATDLYAQLSRIRLLKVDFPGVDEAKQAEDPCPLREPAQGGFLELSMQVPVSATPSRLEYMVQTPTNSEGLYAVCFCHGPECLSVLDDNWQRTGYVKVVRTDAQAEEERDKNMEEEEKDPHEGHEKVGPQKCDTQWQRSPMFSISFSHDQDTVTFRCKEGWQDLQGAESLKCVNGQWLMPQGKEQSAWNQQLPRCRWAHRDCPVPLESPMPSGGGNLQVEDGVARYTCPIGSTMLVDPVNLTLKAGELVELKAGEGKVQGTVLSRVGGSGNRYNIRWWKLSGAPTSAGPTDREDAASLLWVVVKENQFASFCQPGKIWVPAVSVLCRGGSAGGEGGEASVSELTDVTGHGPCGGTFAFGIPEVKKEETWKIIEHLLGKNKSSQPSPLPATVAPETTPSPPAQTLTTGPAAITPTGALLETSEASSSASLLQENNKAYTRSAQPHSARYTRHAHKKARVRRVFKQHSEVDPRTGGPLLHIRKWPIVFSKDEEHSFMVDRCWTSRDCSPPGVVPLDMAAAQPLRAPKETFSASPYLPSVFMGVCVVLVFLLLLFLRNLWLASCGANAGGTKTCFG